MSVTHRPPRTCATNRARPKVPVSNSRMYAGKVLDEQDVRVTREVCVVFAVGCGIALECAMNALGSEKVLKRRLIRRCCGA